VNARAFAVDLDALEKASTEGRELQVGLVVVWLDGRDGHPNGCDFDTDAAWWAYRTARDERARALVAALLLKRETGTEAKGHWPHCASIDLGHACDCGADDDAGP
jgi:hypothetical protein